MVDAPKKTSSNGRITHMEIIGEAWKNNNEHVIILPILIATKCSNPTCGGAMKFKALVFGFSKARVAQLSGIGLCTIQGLGMEAIVVPCNGMSLRLDTNLMRERKAILKICLVPAQHNGTT